MTEAELLAAMRPGSRSPLESRTATDRTVARAGFLMGFAT